MPVGLEALLDILRVQIDSLHLGEDVSVDGDFIKTYNNPLSIITILALHPSVVSYLVNRVSFVLVTVQYPGDEVLRVFRK